VPLIAGRCLACDARRLARFVHRELVLLAVLVGVTIAAFFVTRTVAHGNDELRRHQAAAWFEAARGKSGTAAIAPLRRSVSRDPANRQYRLALARALAATHQDDEARRVLLTRPDPGNEDPDVNLQLARLEARAENADAARRYYENALAALWRPEHVSEKVRVRIELIEFFLAHEERARALSELLILAASLPEEPAIQARAGRMFLAAGDPARALDHYARALRVDSDAADALAGAGQSAFELGDYRRALQYLDRAPDTDPRTRALRDVARLFIASDPLGPRLGSRERTLRLLAALERATQRLASCQTGASPDQGSAADALRAETRALAATIRSARVGAQRDLIEEGVDLMFRAEQAADQRCHATATPFDQALVLIGRRHRLDES
jgi:tetratricopeptide (TPR) repeat protein